ncbi:MAG: glycosyltransferase family 39 protein, partial [Anaerolineae bacterium]|nr:glycosyltransferase family 39 protein [Anaerolineae bacterium]
MIAAVHLGLLFITDLAIVLLPSGNLRAAFVFVLLWVLPGYAWGHRLEGRRWAGFGLGMGINVLLMLLYHYLPGPVSFIPCLILFTLSALIPFAIAQLPKITRSSKIDPDERLSRSKIAPRDCGNLDGHPRSRPGPDDPDRARPDVQSQLFLAALLIITILFRLAGLGYSEFQGDEGIIMVRAAEAIAGDDGELFLHQKGPFEILIPMATWSLNGALNEFWARLPFAWAGILGIAALYQLGRRWFGNAGGLIAGAVMAINGFHIAFARIIQYQDIVVWMGLLALLVLDDYRQRGRTIDLVLGATFLALGALAHYDAVLVVPAAVVLAWRWTPGKPRRFRHQIVWRDYWLALIVGIVILALFYAPFVLNPNFGKTSGYIAEGRVGGKLHFNVEKIWVMSTVYNSSYTVALLFVLALASLLFHRRFRTLLYAWVVTVVPFIFYLIVVFDPRTHIYTFYSGAALLAGAATAGLWGTLKKARWRWAALGVGVAAYVLCAGYSWIMFVDHTPEYQRTWPDNKLGLYWTTYEDMPAHGRFGFPHRAGWQAIGALMAKGTISGTYASNEEQEITDFYTRQAPRTHCPKPDVYIVAENVQDEIRIDREELARDFKLAGVVTVLGEPRIRWYTRDAGPVLTVDQADYRQWWMPEQVAPPTTGGSVAIHAVFNDEIELLGYDLRAGQAHRSGWVEVTLYWRPLVPLVRNIQVTVQLYDGQTLWAQHDSAP